MMSEAQDLRGRTVLVTGASSGIGRDASTRIREHDNDGFWSQVRNARRRR
jgi:NAD(P)-dependent dehydrogenase (short-subunit alcohol dehydrogenase family)